MAIGRRVVLKALAVSGASALGGGAGYGYVHGRHALEITRLDLPVFGLPPSLSGFRIGLLTDTHRSRWVSAEDVAAALAPASATTAALAASQALGRISTPGPWCSWWNRSARSVWFMGSLRRLRLGRGYGVACDTLLAESGHERIIMLDCDGRHG